MGYSFGVQYLKIRVFSQWLGLKGMIWSWLKSNATRVYEQYGFPEAIILQTVGFMSRSALGCRHLDYIGNSNRPFVKW